MKAITVQLLVLKLLFKHGKCFYRFKFLFYRFFIGVLTHFSIITILGLELRLLLMQGATGPLLVMGVRPPRLTYPKQGGHNAATEFLSADGSSLSTSSHPTVLASQLVWITGESQFSRHLPILPV